MGIFGHSHTPYVIMVKSLEYGDCHLIFAKEWACGLFEGGNPHLHGGAAQGPGEVH